MVNRGYKDNIIVVITISLLLNSLVASEQIVDKSSVRSAVKAHTAHM